MIFLDKVYKKLNLSSGVIYGSFIKSKESVSISIKNIKGSYIFAYFIISVFLIFFACLMFLTTDVNIEIDGVVVPPLELNELIRTSVIVFIICTTYIFIKRKIILYKKEEKATQINIYNRELPSNLTPAHARMLVYDGEIDAKTIASTILDLINKGYLYLEKGNVKDIFSKELYISVTDKDQSSLFTYEKFLINWLFDKKRISSIELRNKLNEVSYNPSDNFSIFMGLVLLSFPFDKYYKKINNSFKKGLYIFCFGFVFFLGLLLISIPSIISFVIFISLPIFGIGNLLFANPAYVLNRNGNKTLNDYLALKKFLNDFSIIHERSSEEIVIWNYYLSFSIALGIAGVSSEEIISFFGSNIYNVNNNSNEGSNHLYNIDDEIVKAKNVYQIR